jgi:hypothetical protein
MRWTVAAVALGGVLLGGGLRVRAEPAGTAGGYAVLGLEEVTLRAAAEVELGDVGANRGTVTLGARVLVTGAVAADTVRARQGARAGTIYCRLLEGPARLGCDTLDLPLVDVATLPLVQVLPGAAEVRVPPRAGTSPLPSGAYGAVRVGAGGRLLLAGGAYAVRSITVDARGRVLCAGPCRVSVEERVLLRAGARLGAAAPLDARAVRVDVESGGAAPAFVARERTAVSATVYAPAGDIVLGTGGRYAGAFVGRAVRVGAHALITGASVL